MNYFVKLGLVLLLITAIASGILAFVNGLTSEKIKANKLVAEQEARKEVLSEASRFEKQTVTLPAVETEPNPLKNKVEAGPRQFIYYLGYNDESAIVGYTFVASQYGYSSEVKTMVGVNLDMSIARIKVIEQSETPGLGANAATADFQGRFVDMNQEQLQVDKDGGAIKSLTGATITSRAVTNSIAEGMKILADAMTEEGK
ncbi:MAG: RnfABCDGE type electron transport complex subunit G [Candidatus Cloacimonetes bacterium]|nr:RnfABCDGE type electron transport complex subunit G [Candidatus Cloacimonadota bacterium]